jgi:hypothetical protein
MMALTLVAALPPVLQDEVTDKDNSTKSGAAAAAPAADISGDAVAAALLVAQPGQAAEQNGFEDMVEQEADLQQLLVVSLVDAASLAVWRMLFLWQTEHVTGKHDVPLPGCL